MKNIIFSILISLALLSCVMPDTAKDEKSNSKTEKENTLQKGQITLKLHTAVSRSSINIEKVRIVKAEITLTYPDNSKQTKVWTLESLPVVTFKTGINGNYRLDVVETDQNGTSNSFGQDFYVESGYNYNIDLHLGRSLTVNVNPKIPRTGLVAEYLFNNNVLDSSNNNNNGTVKGPVVVEDRFGQPGAAYRFDGSDDIIEIPNHPTLHSDRGLTISGWVNVQEFTEDWMAVFWKGQTQAGKDFSHREYTLYINKTGFLQFCSTPVDRINIAEIFCRTEPEVAKIGKWLHFVCIVDNDKGQMRIYADGTLAGQISYTTANIRISDSSLFLGRYGFQNWSRLGAIIDDFRIYNRALSISEIQALYNEK